MKAIIQTGGKQYWIAEGDELNIELPLESQIRESNTLKIEEVLYVGEEKWSHIGKPFVHGASVELECLSKTKAPKVIAFKYKRRKGYHRTVGHRQKLMQVKVKKINAPTDSNELTSNS
ncbi:50S ribosomal protein L21 [Methylacidiphilum caldifontis]|uniref:Large ribosomal subunit protein bL21 n=1 Tax=Methylacidiphilum caldifontis TaxID=2795386 RepID=A0A4Y8P6U9_9BACT|nr:50S ribosomal protein L21 [Methylacidiphilum caldifontis]TFE65899.1 50S ribosomal protein L21 [Methylacidiphilum caldifontis]